MLTSQHRNETYSFEHAGIVITGAEASQEAKQEDKKSEGQNEGWENG